MSRVKLMVVLCASRSCTRASSCAHDSLLVSPSPVPCAAAPLSSVCVYVARRCGEIVTRRWHLHAIRRLLMPSGVAVVVFGAISGAPGAVAAVAPQFSCRAAVSPLIDRSSLIHVSQTYTYVIIIIIIIRPTGQSTGMLFRSKANWTGDSCWQPGMFDHLCFCVNGFQLRFNDLILFCCTMVLVMTTGRSRVHCQTVCITLFVIY